HGRTPQRAPPSFPTRRSSDLEQPVLDAVLPPLEPPAIGFLPQAAQDRQLLLQHVGSIGDRREREAVPCVLDLVPASTETELEAADRKSTRLNSSHVSVSYAVF